MYMDDIKLFAKIEKELETLIQGVRISSENELMEFGIEKRQAGIHDRRNRTTKPRKNQNAYKYLGILESDTINERKI